MATRFLGLRNADQNSCIIPSSKSTAPTKALVETKSNVNHTKPLESNKGKGYKCQAETSDDQLDILYFKVGDIDHGRSIQLMPYYVKEIFSYLLYLEDRSSKLRPDFLRNPTELSITPRMRHILFDWLVQVHSRLNLQAETLYLTFHLIDTFMASERGAEVRKSEYQLVGITAMLLASKYEEMYAPSIHDFVYLTDNSYSAKQVRDAEQLLLSELNFFLGHPLPIQFLRRYSRIANATQHVHEMAKYLLECASCRCYQMSHLAPSAMAAASYCLAAELLSPAAGDAAAAWNDALCVYSGYLRQQLQPTIAALASAVIQDQADFKLAAVRKKYAGRNHLMISTMPQLTDKQSLLHNYAADAGGGGGDE